MVVVFFVAALLIVQESKAKYIGTTLWVFFIILTFKSMSMTEGSCSQKINLPLGLVL